MRLPEPGPIPGCSQLSRQYYSISIFLLQHQLAVLEFAGGDEALFFVEWLRAARSHSAAHAQFPGIRVAFRTYSTSRWMAWAP